MASNDFKVFAGGGGANVLTQAQFEALSTLLQNGFQTGIAQSNQVNKVLRQPSIMASMIAQFIVDKTGLSAVDDGTTATLEANFIQALMNTYRVKLASPLNLFVSTTGNDNNNGLSIASPFLTLQKAATVAQNNYDTQGFVITINVAAGNYSTGATLSAQPLGGGQIKFLGNTTNPQAVNVALTSPGACFNASNGARVAVSGIAMSAASGSSNVGAVAGQCLSASSGGTIVHDHTYFGAAQAAQIFATTGGLVVASGPYSVQGSAQYHAAVGVGSQVYVGGQAISIVSGTPAFSVAFVWADAGQFYAQQATFSGSATGARYLTTSGGSISTGGAGVNFLPGSIAGNSAAGYYS